MTTAMEDRRAGYALAHLVARCQHVAGFAVHDDARDLTTTLRQLALDVPAMLSVAERLVVRQVFGQTLARIAGFAGIDHRADVAAAFLEWMRCDLTSDAFFEHLNRLTASCIIAIDETVPAVNRPVRDRRVSRVLDVINREYANPRLSLKAIAGGAGLSVWHATRLVKQHTGTSFTVHLHRVRIAAAQDLLRTSDLSVKEIATAVGYNGSTQLERHFKQQSGITPMMFRRRSREEDLPQQGPLTISNR